MFVEVEMFHVSQLIGIHGEVVEKIHVSQLIEIASLEEMEQILPCIYFINPYTHHRILSNTSGQLKMAFLTLKPVRMS